MYTAFIVFTTFVIATVSILALVLQTWFIYMAIGFFCSVMVFHNFRGCHIDCDQWRREQRQYFFWLIFWLAFLNAAGALRFFGGAETILQAQHNVTDEEMDIIVECGQGWVQAQPTCVEEGGYALANFVAFDWALYLHIAGAASALFIGPFQVKKSIRQNNLTWHRWAGRVYMVCIYLGSVGSFILAAHTTSGAVGAAGFVSLAVLWCISMKVGFCYIRRAKRSNPINPNDVHQHKVWMTRNYAMTFAAVTLRLWLPFLEGAGVDFVTSYQVVAWLSWVLNLFVAELYIYTQIGYKHRPSAVADERSKQSHDSIGKSSVSTNEQSANEQSALSMNV